MAHGVLKTTGPIKMMKQKKLKSWTIFQEFSSQCLSSHFASFIGNIITDNVHWRISSKSWPKLEYFAAFLVFFENMLIDSMEIFLTEKLGFFTL